MRNVFVILIISTIAAFAINGQAHGTDGRCQKNFAYTQLWRVGDITTGHCHDLVNIKGIILESTLYTGLGSDHIRAERLLRGAVLADNGDNVISIATTAYDAQISAGSGKDIITIGGKITRLTVDTGDDADKVVVNGDVYEGSLQTGSGDDVLEIAGKRFVRGHIDMGFGHDVLVLRGPRLAYNITYADDHYIMNSVNQTHIYNVEAIVFDDGSMLVDGVVIEPVAP